MEVGPNLTVLDWQARQIEQAGKILSFFVESTREDRRRWKPSTEPESSTRSVMELIGECVLANRRFMSFLNGTQVGPPPTDLDIFETVEEATAALQMSANLLAEEIRKLGPEDLSREITTHRGPMPIALAIQFPLRNMTYHMGQINMIQLLYGDKEFHINKEFLTL